MVYFLYFQRKNSKNIEKIKCFNFRSKYLKIIRYLLFRFTDLAEMVCRVRENTPDERRMMPYHDTGLSDQDYDDEYYGSETEPDDSDLLTDPDDDCYIDVS